MSGFLWYFHNGPKTSQEWEHLLTEAKYGRGLEHPDY